MNKILFSIIGLLGLAIIGVGLFSFSGNSVVSTNTLPTQTVSQNPTAVTASTYTMAQVATHNSQSSCYTVVNGSVYDLTSFISQHPGGVQAIMQICGIDGTAQFEAQHGGQGRPEAELASLKIGTLAQ